MGANAHTRLAADTPDETPGAQSGRAAVMRNSRAVDALILDYNALEEDFTDAVMEAQYTPFHSASELTTLVAADEFIVYDTTGTAYKKITATNIRAFILPPWERKTSAFNAVAGHRYLCDTAETAAFTAIFPSSANAGDSIWIKDGSSNLAVANLTLGRNGLKFMSADEDYIMDVNDEEIQFVYASAAKGWRR